MSKLSKAQQKALLDATIYTNASEEINAAEHNNMLTDFIDSSMNESEPIIQVDFNANNKKIINLADPTNQTDAVNKKYIDDRLYATFSYVDVAEMLSRQFEQLATNLCRCADATTDPNVGEGSAYYEYLGVATADLADYYLVSAPENHKVDSVNGKVGDVVLGPDDLDDTASTNKFTSQADKDRLADTSGTNTGDQDLSTLALKSNVLELDNTDVFVPDADYEPATKKYVDDNGGAGGGPAIENSYADTAAMIADQGSQTSAAIQFVLDASGDASIITGYAYYEYLGTTVGNLTDYRLIAKEEAKIWDYRILYIDGDDGNDSNTGAVDQPFEGLIAAYAYAVANSITPVTFKIMAGDNFTGFTAPDGAIEFHILVGEEIRNDQIDINNLNLTNCSNAIISNAVVRDMTCIQTGTSFMILTLYNTNVVDLVGSAASLGFRYSATLYERSKITLKVATPDIRISAYQSSVVIDPNVTISEISLFENSNIKIDATPSGNANIGTLSIVDSFVDIDITDTITITGTYNASAVRYANKDKLILTSATVTEVTGEWRADFADLGTLTPPLTIDRNGSWDDKTLVAPLDLTFAESGHVEGKGGLFKLIGDGIQTVTFTKPAAFELLFPLSMTSGDILPTGIHAFSAWFVKNRLEVHSEPMQSAVVAPINPILSNFRIDNVNLDRVYFDSDQILTGTTFAGFTLASPAKTISAMTLTGNGLDNYLTVSVAYVVTDLSPTLAYDGLDDVAGTGGDLLSFTATAVSNNIAPQISSMVVENGASNDLVVTADIACNFTNIGVVFRVDATPRTLTSVAGTGTAVATYLISGAAITIGQVLDFAYDSPTGDFIGVTNGIEVVTFGATTVTNNVVNTSVLLDGSTGYMTSATSTDFELGDGATTKVPFSAAFLFKADIADIPSQQRLFSVADNSEAPVTFSIFKDSNQSLSVIIQQDGSNYITTTGAANQVNSTNWYYIVLTWDGTDENGIEIYIDEVIDAAPTSRGQVGTFTFTHVGASPRIQLGCRINAGTPGNFVDGRIDAPILFDKALNQSEITELNGLIDGDISTFSAYANVISGYRLDSDGVDYKSAHTITLTGGASYDSTTRA